MATKTAQRAIIGSFLIIGTLMALYLTINVGYDLFCVHKAWMYREGLLLKIVATLIYADIPLLLIAGLVSTISFFRKGLIWKPITEGIVINIILWLIYAGLIICLLIGEFIYKICGLLIIGLFAWLIVQIWKMIKSYSQKDNRNI